MGQNQGQQMGRMGQNAMAGNARAPDPPLMER
jgi:hypothetical protein